VIERSSDKSYLNVTPIKLRCWFVNIISGWFTMLDQKVNSDAKVKGFFPVG